MPLSVAAPAKINLSLDITGTRDDGYHLVDTVMQAVSLCDTVTVWESDQPGISLELTGAGADTLPADDTNTAWKAAALFREAVKKRGMEPAGTGIRIHKRIPFAAGLAGGSADAAGVLAALNRLYGSLLEEEELADLGGRVGADVPFCLLGGTAQATGITPAEGWPVQEQSSQSSISAREPFTNAALDILILLPSIQQVASPPTPPLNCFPSSIARADIGTPSAAKATPIVCMVIFFARSSTSAGIVS